MVDKRKTARGEDELRDLVFGDFSQSPSQSTQQTVSGKDDLKGLVFDFDQNSAVQSAVPVAAQPGVPYDPDFADIVGASLESAGVGLGDSFFAGKRAVYNLSLDYFLEHTDQGKELVQRMPAVGVLPGSYQHKELIKQGIITNFEAAPRAFSPMRAGFELEDYLTKKLKADLTARPTEVQENLAVQVAGAGGQIVGTAALGAIPGVGPGLAMASSGAQGFNQVYEESRQGGATMGDAVVGAIPATAAAAVLEPLGARAATGVGKVLNRWNQRSGGAMEKMLDALSKKAGTEAAKRITTEAGETLVEVSADKILADAATATAKRLPYIGNYAVGQTGQAAGRVGRAFGVEFFTESFEAVLANAGVNYATDQELSLLRGVVDEGIVGGSAGALLRSVVETIAGIRARRGAGSTVDLSPKLGDTPLFHEDGEPTKMSEALSGMTPEEFATKETEAVTEASNFYRDQIIASRGQKDSPRYIPETVSTRELAIVIANERKVDMAVAMQAAERAKSMVAERLVREPLEPVFEPTVDPTNPLTWSGLTEEEATAAYDSEYAEYLKQLETFNQRLERQREVARKFGADYIGGVDEMDELRLQAASTNARFWMEMYGDPERGVKPKRGPAEAKVAVPTTTVAKLQSTWQRLFNEEYALELLEADVEKRGQIDLETQRRNQAAIESARANIEAYKQILTEEYRYFPTINKLYDSGAERTAWRQYLEKQREYANQTAVRAALHAQNLVADADKRVSEGERLARLIMGIEGDAKQRADEYRRAMKSLFEPEPVAAFERRQEERRGEANRLFAGATDRGTRVFEKRMFAGARYEPPTYVPTAKSKKEQAALEKAQAEYLEAMGQYAQPEPAAPSAAAAAPSTAPAVVLSFGKTGSQKKLFLDLLARAEEYPSNEDLVEQYGEDAIQAYVDSFKESKKTSTIEVPQETLSLLISDLDGIEGLISSARESRTKTEGYESAQAQTAVLNFIQTLLDQIEAAQPGVVRATLEAQGGEFSAQEIDPAGPPATAPEPQSQIDAQVAAMLNPDSTKKFVFVAEGSPQPTRSLLVGAAKVYAVPLAGEKGGIRGTLYTTDLGLSQSARARARQEGGVTEQQLDQYLYNRSQGKPTDPRAVVVQRRDESGNVVVERASDPADASAVAEDLAGQVPTGSTTVVAPGDALSERQARVASESAPLSAPATPIAVRLGVVQSLEVAQAALPSANQSGGQADVLAALANASSPLSIDQLVGLLPVKPGKKTTPSEHRMMVADALSRLVELGYVVQQTAPDGRTYSSLSVDGEQKFSSAARSAKSAVPAKIPSRGLSLAGLLANKDITNVERYVLQEIEARSKRGQDVQSFADLQSKGSLTNISVKDVETAVRSLASKNLVSIEPFARGVNITLSPSFAAEYNAELEKTRQHQLALNRQAKANKQQLPFPYIFEGPSLGELFERPGRGRPELPSAPKVEPTVGRVMPGVDVWKSRVENALTSDPSGPFEFVSRADLAVLDPTVQETQDAVRGASDEDLLRLLESSSPVGFRRIATEMSIDPVTGLDVVSKVEAQLVQLDGKAVSRESWMVNRQLAWMEMRRRAQAAAIKADLDRSARASTKYPPDPKAPYMRPRNPIKGRPADPDAPVGYVRAPGGKMVPLFDDAGLGMTVTMEPATVVQGEPVNLADVRDSLNDVYNHIALPLTPDVGVRGIDGVYDPESHAAVVGMTWDFGTVSHELSHGIVAWLHGRGTDGTAALVSTMSKPVIDEVTLLGRELYGPRTPAGGYEHEGLAEFFRIYMVSNEAAATHYPATYKWFQTAVLGKDTELAAKIADAQQKIDQYRFQGAEARSRGSEVSREQRRRRMPILSRQAFSRRWTKFLQVWFSDIQSIYDMQRIAKENAVRLGKMTYEQAENDIALNSASYVQGLRGQASLLFRKWVTQHMTMADGRTPMEGGQSLDQAMDPMRGNRDDLMEYMRLMREEWLANQDEPRVSSIDPVTRRTRIAALRAKHGDRIVLAHDNVHRWIKNVIAYCRANSPVYDKVFSDIDESGDTESWVPLQRLVYDVMVPAAMAEGDLRSFTDPTGVATRGATRAGVKTRVTEGALTGSRSPSYNVLEELERNLSSLVAMTHKHMMIRSVLDLANNNPVLRGYIHRVRGADEMFRDYGGAGSDPLLSLGDNSALRNLQALRSMPDVNNDDRVLMSVPVVTEEGAIELETYSLDTVVADAFGSLFPTDVVKGGLTLRLLDLLGRLSTGAVKAFATGVFKPSFQLMIGPMMDFQTIWVNGTYPMGGFKLFYDYPMRYMALGVEAMLEPLGAKFQTKGTRLERMMNVGFESQPTLSAQKPSYFKSVGLSRGQRVVRYLNVTNGDLLRVAERMLSFPSKVGRQLSAENSAKQAGWDGKSALTQAQAAAFMKYYDRTAVDWKEQGRWTRKINRYVAYFGVPFAANRDFVRSVSDQVKDPKKRLQFGLKMALQAGAALAWWVMFDDEDEIKHLSYEEKSTRIPLPVPLADGSTETLLIPKAQSEMLMFSMLQAYLESKSTADPMFWRNRGKAWVAAQLPGFIPGPIEAAGRLMDLTSEEDVRKAVIDSIMPEAGYELSRPLVDYEKYMTPSELMNNPFGTIAGQKISEATNGAINSRKFDALVSAIAGQSLQSFEQSLIMLGMAQDTRPTSAQGKVGDIPVFGRMFAARSGVTMRSPYIRTLYSLQENLIRQLRASREGVLTSDLAAKAKTQVMLANHEAAARHGWATVMAINYIAQNMPDLTNKQRQAMMDHAGVVAETVVVSIYSGKVAPVYDPKQVVLPGTAGPVQTVKQIVEMQQPNYQPKINLPKTFNLPYR